MEKGTVTISLEEYFSLIEFKKARKLYEKEKEISLLKKENQDLKVIKKNRFQRLFG